MKLLNVQFSPVSCYFFPHSSKYLPQISTFSPISPFQRICHSLRPCAIYHNMFMFCSKELLATVVCLWLLIIYICGAYIHTVTHLHMCVCVCVCVWKGVPSISLNHIRGMWVARNLQQMPTWSKLSPSDYNGHWFISGQDTRFSATTVQIVTMWMSGAYHLLPCATCTWK